MSETITIIVESPTDTQIETLTTTEDISIDVAIEGPQGAPGQGGDQDLQEITSNGNTTDTDIEITDLTKGFVLPVTGGRRVRVTATDDGFGNLQLTLTEL